MMIQKKRRIGQAIRPISLASVFALVTAIMAGTSVSASISSSPVMPARSGIAVLRTRTGSHPSGAKGPKSLDGEASPITTITYDPGSSKKTQQINGDCDWAVLLDGNGKASGSCQRTASQTITRANIAGNGEAYSFEQPDTGNLIFLFGDTISNDPSQPWSISRARSDSGQHQH